MDSQQATLYSKYPDSFVQKLLLIRWMWSIPIFLWLLLIIYSYHLNSTSVTTQSQNVAQASAQNLFDMVVLTRLWNANHGKVYVPMTDKVKPNPYLDHPDRDVQTLHGKKLTMINPAFMTRQLAELAEVERSAAIHITSLNPIRPANKADPWETKALEKFKNGVKEVSEKVMVDGKELYRFMGPLMTRQGCIKWVHPANEYLD